MVPIQALLVLIIYVQNLHETAFLSNMDMEGVFWNREMLQIIMVGAAW